MCHECHLSWAVPNCTRDEGGPFEFDNQVLISSQRKPLSSKAMVVNVAENREEPAISAEGSSPHAMARSRPESVRGSGCNSPGLLGIAQEAVRRLAIAPYTQRLS